MQPIVFVDGAFYVIGGLTNSDSFSKTIGRLDAVTLIWTRAGDLLNGRHGHHAIYDGSSIIVVGGVTGSLKTEKCDISDGKVTCKAQNPALTIYSYYPELFMVSLGFCQDWP